MLFKFCTIVQDDLPKQGYVYSSDINFCLCRPGGKKILKDYLTFILNPDWL